MSLHKFADMVAKQGRGDDSLLIHMTPDEVQRLQAFAEANGRSLTINPTTGLPEAGMLSDLFKAVAPIALGAFLGPAGMGLTIGGLSSAATAGLVTGGITSLATGSLSRGLMAGLGAYGGAGLGESLMNAGSASLATQAMTPELMEQAAGAGANYDQLLASEVGAKTAASTPFDTLKAGASAVTDSGSSAMQFAKQNMGNLSAAAAPILAGAMVPTTTKMPENTNPAYIRQKLYDPYTQTYKSLTPVKASEWGSRSFSDAYTNPQTGIASVLDVRKPEPMAAGGIVALAAGGAPTVMSDEDLFKQTGSWEAAAKLRDEQNNALNQYNWAQQAAAAPAAPVAQAAPAYNQYTDQQIGDYLRTNPNVDIAEAIKTTNADPTAVNRYLASLDDPFRGSTDTTGGSGTLGIYNQMKAQGIDPTELYSAATAFDPKYAGWSAADIAKGYQLDKGAYALSDQLKGVVSDKDWAKFMDENNYSVNDMAQAFGLSRNEVQARYNAAKKAPVVKSTGIASLTGGTSTTPVRVTDTVLPTDPTVNAPPGTKTPYGGPNTPGDVTINPDGSKTITPNIPGRPYGGFSGMDEVRDAYTAGGGSLGYTSPVPRTMADFEQLYNKQTGDSLAAYNYLMGKGANNNAYPVQSQAADSTTGIQRPYWSAGMKYKPKFLTANKDGTVTSSSTNPNAAGAATPSGTLAAKTIYVTNNRGESEEATLSADGNYYTSGGDAYDVTGKQVQVKAEGGMTYAMGGGLGSLGSYSDGGRLLKGPGDGVSDSIPATIGANKQPARLADGEFVVPARIVSELGNGSTEAGAKKLYAMMDRVQKARGKTTGKNKVAANSRADKYLPA